MSGMTDELALEAVAKYLGDNVYQHLADRLRGEAEGKAVACTHCGSTELSWQTFNHNGSGVVDGRLRANEIQCKFVLGCDDCSETLRVVLADEVAGMLDSQMGMTATAPVAGDAVREVLHRLAVHVRPTCGVLYDEAIAALAQDRASQAGAPTPVAEREVR